MRSLLEIIFSYIYGIIIIIPLIYSVLFLIKAIFKPDSIKEVSSFFESPFKSRLFNIIAAKSILSIMLITGLFLIFFGISVFIFDERPFSGFGYILGMILFVLYYCCFMGLIYGLGKVSGAGGSSSQVYKELLNIFSSNGSKTKKNSKLHNNANEADVRR